MARLTVRDIEELANIQRQLCISIYIPTHRYGQEVTNGMDSLSLKNELQNIKNRLEDRGLQQRYVNQLLKPAFDVVDDSPFWRELEEGLALFIAEGFFKMIKLPAPVENQNFIAKDFIVTPLLSLLNDTAEFFILDLNVDNIRLFKADKFDIDEIEIRNDMFPKYIGEFLKDFDFEENLHRRNSATGSTTVGTNFHGHSSDSDRRFAFKQEFLRQVETGVTQYLAHNSPQAPLVLVGVDNVVALYQKINHYKNTMDTAVLGNHEMEEVKVIHQKAWEIVKSKIHKPVDAEVEKYKVRVGTGKASYEIEDVFQNALAGRVQTVFFKEDAHLWADIDDKGNIHIHKEQQENDIDLFNEIAVQTVLNSGQAVPVNKEDIPETEVDTELVAVYRY